MSNRRYLQRLGQSWYIRLKVPAKLRNKVGSTHIRRALGTRDLDEANRLKWSAILQIHIHFEALAAGAALDLRGIRLERATTPPTLSPAARLPPHPELRATSGLDALAREWAATSALKTVQFQRQQAYRELRSHLRGNVQPTTVTSALAASYVDERLQRSRDSTSTRRRKLSALAAFWEWMGVRCYVHRDSNPWRGFRVCAQSGAAPKKRPYTAQELLRLFSGTPTYPALREVMVLGLYTGARINEICSLKRGDIRIANGYAFVRIGASKTDAGRRTLAIWHPLPKEILASRMKGRASAQTQLFQELKGGGYDNKLSWHVGQAFRYYRNRCGLGGETDFHSLRRTFITRLENLGVDQVRIARYVGHSLPTLAFKLYSGGATEATQAATGRLVEYESEVERAVAAFLQR